MEDVAVGDVDRIGGAAVCPRGTPDQRLAIGFERGVVYAAILHVYPSCRNLRHCLPFYPSIVYLAYGNPHRKEPHFPGRATKGEEGEVEPALAVRAVGQYRERGAPHRACRRKKRRAFCPRREGV